MVPFTSGDGNMGPFQADSPAWWPVRTMEGELSVHRGHNSALLHAIASLPEVGKGLKPCDTDLVLPSSLYPQISIGSLWPISYWQPLFICALIKTNLLKSYLILGGQVWGKEVAASTFGCTWESLVLVPRLHIQPQIAWLGWIPVSPQHPPLCGETL